MPEFRPSGYIRPAAQGVPSREARAQLQLKRLEKINVRQQEELGRERVPTSVAAASIIKYCNETKDYMVPSVWGRVSREEDPYVAKQSSDGCCTAM